MPSIPRRLFVLVFAVALAFPLATPRSSPAETDPDVKTVRRDSRRAERTRRRKREQEQQRRRRADAQARERERRRRAEEAKPATRPGTEATTRPASGVESSGADRDATRLQVARLSEALAQSRMEAQAATAERDVYRARLEAMAKEHEVMSQRMAELTSRNGEHARQNAEPRAAE